MLAATAGIEVEINVDPALVRPEDPPEIRGDASRIKGEVGWYPSLAHIPLDVTLRDVLAEARSRPSSASA